MGRPRSDIQPRILHAARARFLADGVEGASLRAIARAAKTNIGMVFYYYPTKDDLFLAVVEEVYAKLLADLDAELSGEGDVRARLAAGFARVGRATPEEIDVMRIVVREALASSPRFALVLDRFRRGHIASVLGVLGDGVAHGRIDGALPPPLLLAATVGVGVLPQVMRLFAGGEQPFASLPPPEAMAALSAEVLFEGIGARDAPPRPSATKRRKAAAPRTK